MDNFNKMLDGPDYFFCEKTNCKLRIAVCLQRQGANLKTRRFESTPFLVCQDCPQGMKNRNLKSKGGLKLTEETKMDESIAKDTATETSETVNTRLCECGNLTISPSSPLCPSCMAVRANESRRKGLSKKAKKKNPDKGTHKGPLSSVIVEFGDHQDILEHITRDAREQIRTVSGQIIWTLKNSAAAMKERSSHEKTL